jgi:hypothetical protein
MDMELVRRYFKNRGLVVAAAEYLQNNKDIFEKLLGELDAAIELYNKYRSGEDVGVPEGVKIKNAQFTKENWDEDLPRTGEVKVEQLEKVCEKFLRFEFIDTMKPVEKLARAGIVATYRTCLLVARPTLVEKNVQVASTIEEMLAVMALNGNKTELFEATKLWIEDYEGQGFDLSLAQAVKAL